VTHILHVLSTFRIVLSPPFITPKGSGLSESEAWYVTKRDRKWTAVCPMSYPLVEQTRDWGKNRLSSLHKNRYRVSYNFRMSTLTLSPPSWPEYFKNAYELLDAKDGLIKVAPPTRYEGCFNRRRRMFHTNQLTLENCFNRLGTKST